MKNRQSALMPALASLSLALLLSSGQVFAQQAGGAFNPAGQSGTMQSGAFVQQPTPGVGAAYAAGQVAGNPYGTGYTPYATSPYATPGYATPSTALPSNGLRPDLNPKSPTEVKPEETAKAALTERTHVPTAAEQGLRDTRTDALEQWQATRDARDNSARQRGEQVRQPETPSPVASSSAHRGWLANWEKALTASGVGLEKIRFEEGRLDADEFARWASNQLRYTIGPQPAR